MQINPSNFAGISVNIDGEFSTLHFNKHGTIDVEKKKATLNFSQLDACAAGLIEAGIHLVKLNDGFYAKLRMTRGWKWDEKNKIAWLNLIGFEPHGYRYPSEEFAEREMRKVLTPCRYPSPKRVFHLMLVA